MLSRFLKRNVFHKDFYRPRHPHNACTNHGMSVSCKYCCVKTFDRSHKQRLRLHERDCPKNPHRRTWRCEACDRNFAYKYGLYKHNLSVTHRAGGSRVPKAPKASKDSTASKVSKASKDPQAPQAPQAPQVPRPQPAHGSSFNATDHPMLRDMPSDTFAVIMADPPFRYKRRKGHGVADNHYTTMSDDELRALPVGEKASKEALLILWCSGPTLPRAVALCKAWGFTYKTVAFVWVKTNKRGEPQSMGLGYYTRPGAEFVLVATKGKGASLIAKRPDQVFTAPRTKHSQKPHEMRSMVDAMTGRNRDLRKLELFSRTAADTRWSVWGDQVPEADDMNEGEDGNEDGEVEEVEESDEDVEYAGGSGSRDFVRSRYGRILICTAE